MVEKKRTQIAQPIFFWVSMLSTIVFLSSLIFVVIQQLDLLPDKSIGALVYPMIYPFIYGMLATGCILVAMRVINPLWLLLVFVIFMQGVMASTGVSEAESRNLELIPLSTHVFSWVFGISLWLGTGSEAVRNKVNAAYK